MYELQAVESLVVLGKALMLQPSGRRFYKSPLAALATMESLKAALAQAEETHAADEYWSRQANGVIKDLEFLATQQNETLTETPMKVNVRLTPEPNLVFIVSKRFGNYGWKSHIPMSKLASFSLIDVKDAETYHLLEAAYRNGRYRTTKFALWCIDYSYLLSLPDNQQNALKKQYKQLLKALVGDMSDSVALENAFKQRQLLNA